MESRMLVWTFLLFDSIILVTLTRAADTCLENQFACSDGSTCISSANFCDGEVHCPDGSDELVERPRSGSVNGVPCHRGKFVCVLPAAQTSKTNDLCDRVEYCWPDEYECANENKCIPWYYYCDGMADCRDGSDERSANASSTGIHCRRFRFACSLPLEYKSRKELFCRSRVQCSPEVFACADGNRCVPYWHFCDGVKHCRDGSDEFGYQSNLPGIPCRIDKGLAIHWGRICHLPPQGFAHAIGKRCTDVSTCKPDEFGCLDGSGCLKRFHFCDGRTQCRDGSDEISMLSELPGIPCRYAFSSYPSAKICKLPLIYASKKDLFCSKEPRCRDDEFACLDGTRCVSWRKYCSEEPFCNDKSDTYHINSDIDGISCRVSHRRITYYPYQYDNLCKLPRIYAAKAEEICNNEVSTCRPYEFMCADGKRCLRVREFCDGIPQCRDGSDEIKPTRKTKYICRNEQHFCSLPRRLLRTKHFFCRQIVKCLRDEFECSDGKKCIPKDQYCDGTPQCSDSSDEILPDGRGMFLPNCLRENGRICVLPGEEHWKSKFLCKTCKSNEFWCKGENRCHKASAYCSDRDCLDRRNFTLSTNVTGIPCRYNNYVCILPENEAHKKDLLCKKDPECNDDEFACLDGTQCLLRDWFCDGRAQCSDGSDEFDPESDVDGVLCMGRELWSWDKEETMCILPAVQAWKKSKLCRY